MNNASGEAGCSTCLDTDTVMDAMVVAGGGLPPSATFVVDVMSMPVRSYYLETLSSRIHSYQTWPSNALIVATRSLFPILTLVVVQRGSLLRTVQDIACVETAVK